MLGQAQTQTHLTSTHYKMLPCLRLALGAADGALDMERRRSNKEFSLKPHLDPEVSLHPVKPSTLALLCVDVAFSSLALCEQHEKYTV